MGYRKKHLYRYKFDIPENVLTNSIGKVLKKLRSRVHNYVIFQFYLDIITEYRIADEIIKEFSQVSVDIKDKITSSEFDVSIKNAIDNEEIKEILLRFVGELIALTLKNRDEKILVYDEFGKNVYHTTFYEKNRKFAIISLYKGFKYKPILFEDKLALIIDPKSKYFTESTLRSFLTELDDIDYNRGIEQLCPIQDCDQHLKPFTICDYGNPRHLGYTSDLKKINKKPSECNPNLIKYFKIPEKCPTALLGEFIAQQDQSPVIKKYFFTHPEGYDYPLDLLRIIPNNDDAGEFKSALTEETRLTPKKRQSRIIKYFKYTISIGDFAFPLIPQELVKLDDKEIKLIKYKDPSYLLRKTDRSTNKSVVIETENPRLTLNEKDKDFFIRKEKVTDIQFIIISDGITQSRRLLKYLIDKKENPDSFESYSGIGITYKIIDINQGEILNRIYNTRTTNQFLILFGRNKSNSKILDLKKELIEKNVPNQTILKKTINYGPSPFKNSIYYQILNKIGFLPWGMKFTVTNNPIDTIVGIQIKNSQENVTSAILGFNLNGSFNSGVFLNESKEDFSEKFTLSLKKLCKNFSQILLLIHGNISNDHKNLILDSLVNKKYAIYKVSSSSFIRFFKEDYNGKISNDRVRAGIGLLIEDSLHIISYEFAQGTQASIEITEIDSNFGSKEKFYEQIYQMTQYNPSYFRNSIKIPFPIHFASKTLTNGIKLGLGSISFSIPFYL